jgi:hypothetical protein
MLTSWNGLPISALPVVARVSIPGDLMKRTVAIIVISLAVIAARASNAMAQPLGVFSWQLSPYCNVITLTATYNGSAYRLEGFDNQCGAPARATAIGIAVFNPNGLVSFGLTVVSAPGAMPVHIEVQINPSTLGGTWRDSSGNTGVLIFNPSAPGGSPRPAPSAEIPPASVTGSKVAPNAIDGSHVVDGSIGAADVVLSEIQRRVVGTCSASAFMRAVNQDGSVQCEAGVAGGDITAVVAGTGLVGGGTVGDVGLGVIFGNDGTATSAARTDHQHTRTNGSNTAIGIGAMLALTTGTDNTALGFNALASNATGNRNIAIGREALNLTASSNGNNGSNNIGVGYAALKSNMTGVGNIGIGTEAAWQSATGAANVAVGHQSLFANLIGSQNVALGRGALGRTNGTNNIGIGDFAGFDHQTGDNNIYIGHNALNVPHEDTTMRIGQLQTRVFVAGIRGATTGVNDAVSVVIDSAGQLGTLSSSARYKEDIADMASASSAIMRLRPVTFRYRRPFADGGKPLQYGLIAEEVAEVMPSLAVLNAAGEPETVKYQELPALLLNELQRVEREKQALNVEVAAQREELSHVRQELAALRAMVERLTSSKH